MAAGRISVCLGKTSQSPRRGAWQDKCWHPEVVSGDAAAGDGVARGRGSLHSLLLVAPELCEHEGGGAHGGGGVPTLPLAAASHAPTPLCERSRPGRPLGCRGLSWLRAVIWHARAKRRQTRPEESSSQQRCVGGRGSGGRAGSAGGVPSSRVTRGRSVRHDAAAEPPKRCASGQGTWLPVRHGQMLCKFTVAVALCRSRHYCGAVQKSVGLLGAREEQVVKRDSPSRAAGSSADPADCYGEQAPAALPSRLGEPSDTSCVVQILPCAQPGSLWVPWSRMCVRGPPSACPGCLQYRLAFQS